MSKEFRRCYMDHPPLVIGNRKIYGGSCIDPIVPDADIYVGFDLSMARSHLSYPWETGESFLFYIQDMGVPKDPDQFKKLIEWLAVQLAANKKVHLGCIGGHGRTGLVLSALVKHMTGEVDAIQYVRKNYCEKVVESEAQVKFLMHHFGVSQAKGHKESSHRDYSHRGRTEADSGYNASVSEGYGSQDFLPPSQRQFSDSKGSWSPNKSSNPGLKVPSRAANPTSIWGSSVTIDKLDKSSIITV